MQTCSNEGCLGRLQDQGVLINDSKQNLRTRIGWCVECGSITTYKQTFFAGGWQVVQGTLRTKIPKSARKAEVKPFRPIDKEGEILHLGTEMKNIRVTKNPTPVVEEGAEITPLANLTKNCFDWTFEQMLQDMIKELKAGTIKASKAVIIYQHEPKNEDDYSIGHWYCHVRYSEAIPMLQVTTTRMLRALAGLNES